MATFRAIDYHLNEPGTLIAALPAVLGFVPEKSLALVTVVDGQLACVLRVDLSEVLLESLDHLTDVVAASAPEAAVAVIVDDGASCPVCMNAHRVLVRALTVKMRRRGIALTDAYVVDRLAAGGRWCSADAQPGFGTIDDPMSSPMAAAAVLDGRPLYPRRADLEDVIATADPVAAESLRAAMLRGEHGGDLRPDAAARGDLEHVMAVARALAAGSIPSESEVVRLGCGFTDTRVRDMSYALAVGRDAGLAEALWALLGRTLPDPWRVEALVLLAFSAYARGDGPLAGVSLEAALRSDGSHRMACMLDQALQTGMRPEQIRELAQTGYRLAKQLGVSLPPRHSGVRRQAG